MLAGFPANGLLREREDEKRAARWPEHLFSNDDSANCFCELFFVERFAALSEAFTSMVAMENFCI